jgi:hypothetical protein
MSIKEDSIFVPRSLQLAAVKINTATEYRGNALTMLGHDYLQVPQYRVFIFEYLVRSGATRLQLLAL